ncbi:MAG: hypothetical protein REJ23_11635 [Brevundimonas sp.]|nr:hypothetical protein [Brevundimonas sp.]
MYRFSLRYRDGLTVEERHAAVSDDEALRWLDLLFTTSPELRSGVIHDAGGRLILRRDLDGGDA